jgi:Cu/Zn superoxide dismutase
MTLPVAGLALLMAAGPAAAAEGSARATLAPVPVNPVNASGTGSVQISGTTLSFTLAAKGLLAGAPHAAHIHFGATARNECPTASDNNAAALSGETDPHQHFTTTEGAPAYGEIVVSLTTTGDTSPASGLAVDRFAVGDNFEYSRGDVQVSDEVAQAILGGKAVVVVHGVDYDGSGTYSAGSRGVSDLDASLPGEATDPALCGVLNATPVGGVAAGDGSSSGESSTLPYVLGGLGLTAAGGAAFAARRNSRATA